MNVEGKHVEGNHTKTVRPRRAYVVPPPASVGGVISAGFCRRQFSSQPIGLLACVLACAGFRRAPTPRKGGGKKAKLIRMHKPAPAQLAAGGCFRPSPMCYDLIVLVSVPAVPLTLVMLVVMQVAVAAETIPEYYIGRRTKRVSRSKCSSNSSKRNPEQRSGAGFCRPCPWLWGIATMASGPCPPGNSNSGTT
jgi:hypothetical protein